MNDKSKNKQRWRSLVFSLCLLLFSTTLTLLITEGTLRFFGFAPKPVTKAPSFEGGWASFDPQLGWVNNPGGHPSTEPGNKIMHFDADHTRRVVGPAKEGTKKLLFVGCSFTQGYGIEDQYTFASVIDNDLPQMKALNFGTGGYSTYQAWLTMRNELKTRNDVSYIVYPFLEHHLLRNVADASWIQALELKDGRMVVPPYARIRANEIHEFPGHIEKTWFLEMHSALIHLTHSKWIIFRHTASQDEMEKVTQTILSEMDSLAKRKGIPFLVAGLMYEDQGLINKVVNKDIRFVDCRLKLGFLNPQMRVGGVGHPNELANIEWAQCIKYAL